MAFFFASEINRRSSNEDSYCQMEIRMNAEAAVKAMVVADGMGGLSGGKYYSEAAVNLWYQELLQILMSDRFKGNPLDRQIEILQEMQDYCELPDGCFQNLIPIGDFGAGWGPMCLDLRRPEESVDPNNEETWAVVWFDHEEFDWDRRYLGEDGLLHGRPAAPDLKTLLEWCLCGSLETEFEEKYGIRPTYEWYQNGAEY